MLVKCPECELQVSDKAISCPHCGYPLKTISENRPPRKSSKHKRLPNGFGQISMIKGRNLRKPYRAMVTVGKDEWGKPISKLLKPQAYFETYNDAYAALVEYNKKPYDLDLGMTLEELYDVWSKNHFKTLTSYSTIRNIENTWSRCSSIKNLHVIDLRPRHIKYLLEMSTPVTQVKIKSLFNQMLDYALEYEIVDKNVSRNFKLSSHTIKELNKDEPKHIAFSEEEINKLWKNINFSNVDMILFQCYSGWRPKELGLLEVENINTTDWTMIGGLKTESGKNRLVPIHPCVREIVKCRLEEAKNINSKYLFNRVGCRTVFYAYEQYKYDFDKVIKTLNLSKDHKPHDGRKTFVTLAKQYNVDEYAIKYIVGHKIQDLTEKTYTERNTEWLRNEIEKIKSPCI